MLINFVLSEALWADNEKNPLRILSSMTSDWKYEWYLDHARILAQPDWDPLKGNPPLSIEKAIKIACDKALALDKDFSSPVVSSISLNRFLRLQEKNEKEAYTKWFYHLTIWSHKQTADQPLPKTCFIIVLMDGSVVDFKKTKVESEN